MNLLCLTFFNSWIYSSILADGWPYTEHFLHNPLTEMPILKIHTRDCSSIWVWRTKAIAVRCCLHAQLITLTRFDTHLSIASPSECSLAPGTCTWVCCKLFVQTTNSSLHNTLIIELCLLGHTSISLISRFLLGQFFEPLLKLTVGSNRLSTW